MSLLWMVGSLDVFYFNTLTTEPQQSQYLNGCDKSQFKEA